MQHNTPVRSINLYRKIALSFILLTIALFIIVFYFSFAKLTIVLIPNKEKISDNLIIDIYDKNKNSQFNFSNQAIQGTIDQIQITESKIYPSSKTEIIGGEIVGKVTIINNYSKNQPLVATTRLLGPDNKLFRIKKTVNVPAGESVEVEIYADEPSLDMEINPAKFTIPGLWVGLRDKIYGESKEKFIYQKQVKQYIQQSDIDHAIQDLQEILLNNVKLKIGEKYQNNNKIIYQIDKNTINTEISNKAGEEKKEFNINMSAMVVVITFQDDEIYNIAEKKLFTIIPVNKKLINFNKNQITYNLSSYDIKQAIATINVFFEGQITLKNDVDIIDRTKITGLNREQIGQYLNDFNEIAGYELQFYPSFINKAPRLVDKIIVKIK